MTSKPRKNALYNGLSTLDGQMNALTLLGKTLVDLGETQAGIKHLLSAYMLDGTEVFAESPHSLKLLKERCLIS